MADEPGEPAPTDGPHRRDEREETDKPSHPCDESAPEEVASLETRRQRGPAGGCTTRGLTESARPYGAPGTHHRRRSGVVAIVAISVTPSPHG
jgi:hypothetical protein